MLSVHEIKDKEVSYWLKWINNLPEATAKEREFKHNIKNDAFAEAYFPYKPEGGRNYYIVFDNKKEQLLIKLNWTISTFLNISGYARIYRDNFENDRTEYANNCLAFLLKSVHYECRKKEKQHVQVMALNEGSYKTLQKLSNCLPKGFEMTKITQGKTFTFKISESFIV